VLDVGIGFGKTPEQNFELIARLEHIRAELPDRPFLVGASRKSFLKLATGESEPHERIAAGITVAIVAVQNGATIIRTHDVAETVQALRTIEVLNENA
jgi:dihydropteroate synthase